MYVKGDEYSSPDTLEVTVPSLSTETISGRFVEDFYFTLLSFYYECIGRRCGISQTVEGVFDLCRVTNWWRVSSVYDPSFFLFHYF